MEDQRKIVEMNKRLKDLSKLGGKINAFQKMAEL